MIVIGEYRVYFQMLIQPLIFFACNAFSTNFLINCFYLIYITCILVIYFTVEFGSDIYFFNVIDVFHCKS